MAFKKHAPKHQRHRASIRRGWCPYCDGMGVIASMQPNFGANIEGHSLPFTAAVMVSGYVAGHLLVTFTWPDREYQVFSMPDYERCFEISDTPHLAFDRKTIERKRQQFAFPIDYCPKCGRKFKNNRTKLWR